MYYQIKGISLDIWKTILQSNPTFKPLQVKLFAEALEVKADEQWIQIIKKADQEADKQAEASGSDVGFKERLEIIAELAQIPLKHSEKDIEEIYTKMEKLFLIHLPFLLEKNLLDILASLKTKGLQLFLVSNTGFVRGATMRKALEQLGISVYIDLALFSDEIGFAKPHPAIFGELCQKTTLQADEVLHIGDNLLADYTGARDYGMQSLCYNPNNLYFANEIHQIDSLNTLLRL